MSTPYAKLPGWVEYGLHPADQPRSSPFLVAGLVVLLVGENPFEAAYHLINGAFGSGDDIGFTLYYATTFIFTGLAVAVAFHAGLFNIGGEGQAYVGGLGVALVCLWLDQMLPWCRRPSRWRSSVPRLFGALPGRFCPAGCRPSAAATSSSPRSCSTSSPRRLMVYLLVDVLKPLGSMSPQTRQLRRRRPAAQARLAAVGSSA